MKFLNSIKAALGIETVAAKEGKIQLSAEQTKVLQDAWGENYPAALANAETELALQASEEEKRQLAGKVEEQQRILAARETTIRQLMQTPEAPKKELGEELHKNMQQQSALFVFGVNHEFYKKDKWYNKIGYTNNSESVIDERKFSAKMKDELIEDSITFGTMLQERYQQLARPNRLPELRAAYKAWKNGNPEAYDKFAAAGDIDVSGITTAIPSGYLVRRMDALLMYMEELVSVDSIFPIEYNITDGAIIGDAFITNSLTQSYQENEAVAKGSSLQAENIARVKDAMVLYKFANMKKLERYYFSYLWRADGSSPIKFTFIEWLSTFIMRKMRNESTERAVHGVYVKSTDNKKAHHAYASDGVLTTHERLINENRVYQLDSYKTYDQNTIVEYIENFLGEVHDLIGTGSFGDFELHMNALHVKWYLDGYRKAYGTDQDFTGDRLRVINTELDLRIVRIPNMGPKRYDMFVTVTNNYRQLRNLAGEEFNFTFRNPDLFSLLQFSTWKEGTAAMWQGYKYASQSALQTAVAKTRATNTKIFANMPATALVADATTVSAAVNRYFVTIANTGATAITDITSATDGVLYRIELGSTTNATTIAKAGKFSTITAAWIPTAVGDYIRVIYDPTGAKFYEYDRKVGGTITENTGLVAPEFVESF